jgi:hypothetical protein
VQQLIRYLPAITTALLLLLSIRLFTSGLVRSYRWFTLLVFADLVFAILFQTVQNGTNQYAEFYFAAQPIQWIIYIGVIFELYSLVLREHVGILAFGRKWLIRALGIAALFSVSTLFINLQAPEVGHPFLDSFHMVERLVDIFLVLFLILLITVLAWFPIQLKSNIIVLCSVFGVRMLSRAGIILARNILGLTAASMLRNIPEFLTLATTIALVLFFRPSGESSRLRIGHQWNHADEARILAQLDAINASLLRSTKE